MRSNHWCHGSHRYDSSIVIFNICVLINIWRLFQGIYYKTDCFNFPRFCLRPKAVDINSSKSNFFKFDILGNVSVPSFLLALQAPLICTTSGDREALKEEHPFIIFERRDNVIDINTALVELNADRNLFEVAPMVEIEGLILDVIIIR